jgi:dienelactone hydrolase
MSRSGVKKYKKKEQIMKKYILLLFVFIITSILQADVKTDSITYNDDDLELQGYFAHDQLLKAKRGGVLLIHDKNGHDAFIRERADELASLGYVVFALDMFGKGKLAKDASEANDLVAPFLGEDRQLMRHRANLGFEILSQHKKVDPTRIAAVGYGFGGITVLELVRSGQNILAAANFYGNLSTQTPEDARNIKGSVLILQGSEDKMVSQDEIAAFRLEMKEANVDWQMNIYGGALSGFSVYDHGFDTSEDEAYNYNADKRSWEALKVILREKLK